MSRPRFNRILLKLSGEALMGQGQFGIDPDTVNGLAAEIAAAKARATSFASSSEAATSSGESLQRPRVSTGPAPITWACWRP
jgi:hypothetical protein